MARLPQPRAVFRLGRPFERPAAEFRGDLAEPLGLFGRALLGAVEFDEQHRLFRQREFRIGVAGLHLQFIEQFDARHRNAGLDGHDGRVARRLDRRKRADAGGNRFRNAVQLQRDFGDDAERAFGADEQPREIVTGGRFFRAARGRDQLAVGEHGFERQHIVLHGAVAHRVGARRARRRHAAERGVGAGIDRKEQALVAQIFVELLARDARLDHAIEIFGMDRENAVHVLQVDADAAARRIDLAFERGAGAERE